MSNKNIFILISLYMSLTLGACTRSATTAGVTPTLDGDDSIANILNMKGTLTAQAPSEGTGGGENGLDPFSATATPVFATVTPTESPTAAPTDPQSVPNNYTLQKHEYPYCLARRFDVDINTLMSMNGLTPSSLYAEGLSLTIPQNSEAFVGERMLQPHPAQYTVMAGDTIFLIACKFGDVYPEAIAQANGFGLDATLTVGQVLQIP